MLAFGQIALGAKEPGARNKVLWLTMAFFATRIAAKLITWATALDCQSCNTYGFNK
ncbi:hypothetical protein DFP86_11766 [Paludibacterium purpuratum]|uniref:Uncharacterized protein n=1 Tax=Paludibacterium purpuratum TaxID=1144873 RepID=A0A4R7AZH5_9NEIS|nr:hypothetical protein DFP86_11766 [Paludibacterium purpuratum]